METRAYELSKIPIVITNPSHVRSEMIVSIKSRFSLTVVPPFLPEPKKKPKQEHVFTLHQFLSNASIDLSKSTVYSLAYAHKTHPQTHN
eukprot:1353746-Amorphochlora_amoeboformis.AAC.1